MGLALGGGWNIHVHMYGAVILQAYSVPLVRQLNIVPRPFHYFSMWNTFQHATLINWEMA